VLIKSAENERLNFDNMISYEEHSRKMERHNTSTASLVFDKPLKTKLNNRWMIEGSFVVLQPNSKVAVPITLDTKAPEAIDQHLEVCVRDGSSQFVQLMAEIQRPHVSLNRSVMNLGRIYAGVAEYVNPQSKHAKQSLTLSNYGNLPAHFRFCAKNNPERIIASIEPSSGVIQPKSEIKVKLNITAFVGGVMNELFICDVRDMELPIGFELMADIYGLNVAYETQEDQSASLT
jgi:hypothetical protein